MKKNFAVILLLACASSGAFAANVWFEGLVDNNWSTGGNWANQTTTLTGTAPVAGDNAMISAFYYGGPTVTCNADVSFSSYYMYVGYNGKTGILNATTSGVVTQTTGPLSVGIVGGTGIINIGNGGKFKASGTNVVGDGGTGTINVNNLGILETTSRLNLSASGTLSIASGGTATLYDLAAGSSGAGTSHINMTGGTLQTTGGIYLGLGSPALMNLSGGSVVTTDMNIGYSANGTLAMTGGTITAGGNLGLGAGAGIGTLNISGGAITAAGLSIGAGSNINFLGIAGNIVLGGNKVNDVTTYIAAGKITADGTSGVGVNYDAGTNKTTIVHGPIPAYATMPNPADDVGLIDAAGVTLSWKPGGTALSHNVYFGTNRDALAFMGNHEPNSFPTGSLSPDTIYYWRIDEVNSVNTYTGNTWSFTTKPSTFDPDLIGWWKFDSATGGMAVDSSGYGHHGTIYGAVLVDGYLNSALNFNGSTYYMEVPSQSLAPLAVSQAVTVLVRQYGTADAGTIYNALFNSGQMKVHLPFDGVVYWDCPNSSNRIEKVASLSEYSGQWNNWAFVKNTSTGYMRIYLNGTLWQSGVGKTATIGSAAFFYIGANGPADMCYKGLIDDFKVYKRELTAGEIAAWASAPQYHPKAKNPSPSDAAVNVATGPTLSWQAGDGALSHNVYFGTDQNALVFKGNQSLASTTFNPGVLIVGQTYYWRIDEVTASGVEAGVEWFFIVGNSATVSYLDNGVIRIGVDTGKGGTITYLKKNTDGRDIINDHDLGRMAQQSYYCGPQPFMGGFYNNTDWAWNPVAAGDVYNNPSIVQQWRNTGGTIYVKRIPKQWALNNVNSECTMEEWITLEGNVAKVRCRLNNTRPDITFYGGYHQELPALYTNIAFNRIFTYSGAAPFTSGGLTQITADIAIAAAYFQATESWSASVDSLNWGVGLYSPNVQLTGGGTYGSGGTPDGVSTVYLTSIHTEHLDYNIVYEYEYYLIVGSLTEIRNYVYAHRPPTLPDWNFRKDRQHWFYINATDSGWPIQGNLHVNLTGSDPQMMSPVQQWNAVDVPKLYIRAKYNSANTSAQLFWLRSGDGAGAFNENESISFTLISDNQYHTYEVNLSSNASYTGSITQLRFDPVAAGAAGNYVDIEYISAYPIPGDYNRDKMVNIADFAVLSAHWQEDRQPGYTGDLDYDRKVDGNDLNIFVDHWLDSVSP